MAIIQDQSECKTLERFICFRELVKLLKNGLLFSVSFFHPRSSIYHPDKLLSSYGPETMVRLILRQTVGAVF
jgi:hypothetical protein